MMNSEQKQAARNLIDYFKGAGNEFDEAAVASRMADMLQELVDADDKFKIGVLAAINAAAPDARHVEVDGQPVFFSKSGDDITDTHTLAPCPHCGGSGAAEDCAPEPEPFGYFKSEPFGWTDCAETYDGAIALYTAPPAPSVPDVANTFKRRAEEIVAMAVNRENYAKINRTIADLVMDIANAAEATTPAEAPADVARDAGRYRWLRRENAKPGLGFYVGNDTDTMPGDITWIGSDLDAAIDAAMREKGGA